MKTNSLLALYPEIASEIDLEKNNIDPSKIKYGSHDELWWKCFRGHSYKCMIALRTTKGYGCPTCSAYGTSFGEQMIYRSLKRRFSTVYNRYKELGVELDVYVPELNLAIEYSGKNWHEGKEQYDSNKRTVCENNNIELFVVLEEDNREDAVQVDNYTFKLGGSNKNKPYQIIDIINKILSYYDTDLGDVDITEIISEANEYRHGKPEPGQSLIDLHPELIKDWDYDKNTIPPNYLTPGSNYEAYWKCYKCGTEWEATIVARTSGNKKCPKCYTVKNSKSKMKSRYSLGEFI